jgi:nucleoside transporter
MSHLAEVSTSEATPPAVRRKLAGMMFLQYFMQGAYLTIVSMYLKDALHFSNAQIGWFMAALAVGPLLAPFVVGQLVDRMLPTERVLAACHFLGGLVMIALYFQSEFMPVIVLGTLYSVLYIPTTMLTNAMAFHHLRNRDREFPLVRVWGTIGFCLPAWFILFFYLRQFEGEALNRAQGIAFLVAGATGLLMAVYCLTLPHTPPNPRGSGRFAPGVVLGLMKRRDFAVLFAVTFFIAAVHNYFFVWNSPNVKELLARNNWSEGTQAFTTIGQIMEIAAMGLLAASIAKLGYKRTMLLGASAYALRCVAFAFASTPELPFAAAFAIAAAGQALHGFCFAFFMATAFIYIDRAAPPDVKGSLQTIYGNFIMGIGFVVGGIWGGRMGDAFSQTTVAVGVETTRYEWSPIWLWCAAAAAACVVVLALLFPRAEQTAFAPAGSRGAS